MSGQDRFALEQIYSRDRRELFRIVYLGTDERGRASARVVAMSAAMREHAARHFCHKVGLSDADIDAMLAEARARYEKRPRT
jgi:hypothetical protein